jgi:hypothetical protein
MADFVERHTKSGALSAGGRVWGERLDIVAQACRRLALSRMASERVDTSGNAAEAITIARIDAEGRIETLFDRITRRVGLVDARILRMMFVDGRSAEEIARREGRPQHAHYYRLRIIDALNCLGGEAAP